MLSLADLQVSQVCGDGNCGIYACLATRNDRSVDHVRTHRQPTARDYEKQQELRDEAADWLLHTDQRQLCLQFGPPLAKAASYNKNTGKWTELADEAIKKYKLGRTQSRGPMGVYATDGLLRAIAEVEGVNIVVIDTAALQDGNFVYCPGKVMPIRMSWAQEIVPKLERQRMGKNIEAPYRVIIYNGHLCSAGHFDATCASDAAMSAGLDWTQEPIHQLTCSICQDALTGKAGQRNQLKWGVTPCGHTFHSDCLSKWVQSSRGATVAAPRINGGTYKKEINHQSCPDCRKEITTSRVLAFE